MKILFVDDEFFLLEGLQLRLLPICQNWEMEFAGSGGDALSLMAETPFDAIVADMHMPGMSGPELLNEVMKQYPSTVRILLCEPAEGASVDTDAAFMHEFLSKNCDAEDLKTAILCACGKNDAPSGDKLEKLMAKITRLPSIPTLYIELIQLMKNPDADIEDIGDIISRDMTMTAMVLKMANSAFFGLQRVVSSTSEATMYLGVETLRSLALSAQVFSQFQSLKLPGFSVDALWNHSLETAAAAKTIAQLEGAAKNMLDEAFVAGILHDIGKLVLASNFSTEYGEVLRMTKTQAFECRKAEQEVFGVNHADVGGRLLKLWDLPYAVGEAVAFHHDPSGAAKKTFSTLTTVHAANVIVREKEIADGDPTPQLDMEYLNELGLSARPTVWRATLIP